jgi:peroxin-5
LRQWLYSKYKDMSLPQHPPTHYNTAWSSHELTSDAFLQVARALHSQGKTDPEVQMALGVLFYSNADFEKAKDCFESALHSRPDVCFYLRKGVTLALTSTNISAGLLTLEQTWVKFV